MTTTTRKVQNPDNLTPEQVGEGYRLTFEEERGLGNYDKRIEIWVSPSVGWQRRIGYPFALSRLRCYRIPLDAPAPPPPERFTIKPLVWKGNNPQQGWICDTPFGRLWHGQIEERGKGVSFMWMYYLPNTTERGVADTLEAAKAAAESAYEARVKELLIPA